MTGVVVLAVTALIWVLIAVLVGRAAIPPAERVRLRCWTRTDVGAAAAIGAREIVHALTMVHRRTTEAL